MLETNAEPRVLMVACLHGDEEFGAQVAQIVKDDNGLSGVRSYIANPEAVLLRKRFVDEDINRCFNKDGTVFETLERERAHRLVQFGEQFDFVVDIHTGKKAPKKSIVATNLNEATKRVINSHDSDIVALMPEGLSGSSFIGQFNGTTTGAVSLEYNTDFAQTEQAFDEVTDCLGRLADGTVRRPKLREILIISGLIGLDEVLDPDIDYNLKQLPDGESYGYLVGDPAYTTHQGFRASHISKVYV